MYTYISLGGWCGTRMALDQANLVNEPHNIFDHIRSSSRGIVDCIETNFSNFLPEDLTPDTRYFSYKPFIGKYFGFFHNGDLREEPARSSIQRKIARFHAHCESEKPVIFLRTCVIPDYERELKDMVDFKDAVHKKYPRLTFIVVFIVRNQDVTEYHSTKHGIFIFKLNDDPSNQATLGIQYMPIFNFIQKNDLFNRIPPDSVTTITEPDLELYFVERVPFCNLYP